MATNRLLLNKGIKFMLGSLPLLFLGPSVIHNALINRDKTLHYYVLAVGILLCFVAVFLAFKGIMLIIKSLFEEDQR